MKGVQLPLFAPPAQRGRRRSPEDPRLFKAVVALRKAGHMVYAAGQDHRVDDSLFSTEQLLALAASIEA